MDQIETVDLSITKHVWCPLHGAPFRDEFSEMAEVEGVTVEGNPEMSDLRVVVASNLLLMVAAEGFEQMVPDFAPPKLPELLAEMPACCRASNATLYAIYVAAGHRKSWADGECDVCGRRGLGSRFEHKGDGDEAQAIEHLCFNCLCSDRVMPAPPEGSDGGNSNGQWRKPFIAPEGQA